MAAHLEKCKYFDHCVPLRQFSYCFLVPPDGNKAAGSCSGSKCQSNEIALEYAPGQLDDQMDEIALECLMSDDTDTCNCTETSNSDSELQDED